MSVEITCDTCGDRQKKISNSLIPPSGWMTINISGSIPNEIKQYAGHQSVKRDICLECAKKIFPQDLDPQPSFQDQFAIAVYDMLQEMVSDALSEMEGDR